MIGRVSGMALGSSRLFCLHCVCMFGLFALFVCVTLIVSLSTLTLRSEQNNTHLCYSC